MKNWFKKVEIPSGETKEVVAYKSWIVRWYSIHGNDTEYPVKRQQSEIFPSEEDANRFAEALRGAYILTKCSGNCVAVWVEENQNKLASLAK